MWGFSTMEDLARRAQEEAAKLAVRFTFREEISAVHVSLTLLLLILRRFLSVKLVRLNWEYFGLYCAGFKMLWGVWTRDCLLWRTPPHQNPQYRNKCRNRPQRCNLPRACSIWMP